MVKKIILVFKTHFDIGFTDLSAKVIDNYADSMLKEVIATCKATEAMGKLKYVWTLPAWPLKIITERCGAELKKELDLLIERGQIAWHALPFTSHTDFCSAEEYMEGLRFGRELSYIYHKPYPISAKMTDVPGHGLMLPAILSGAGIKFLHLGCNEFAKPPKVPLLFYWQALSGEKVLTMYSKGGYGTSLLPPENWSYPVWMALMHTKDNSGPQSAAVIGRYVKKIRDKYPEAEIVCGTMDDFYRDLSRYDLKDVPTVTRDLADTWIHGIGAYPREISLIREEREKSKRLQAILAKLALEGDREKENEAAGILDRYYENTCLFGEHTWGADVKTWLGPNRVYHKKDFLKAKQTKSYLFMEASWEEQRDRAKQSRRAMQELKALVENKAGSGDFLFNPGSRSYTGWVSLKEINKDFAGRGISINGSALPITKVNGEWACFVNDLPPFKSTALQTAEGTVYKGSLGIRRGEDIITVENHRYSLTFSASEGYITELYDKELKAALLKQQNQKTVFSYQYDRYGIEEVTSYLKDYAYRFSTWGVQDYGREAYPECGRKTYAPKFRSFSIENDSVIFNYTNKESMEWYGDAGRIRLEVTLPPAGGEIFIDIKLNDKTETPYIESGSFLLPVAEGMADYRINKPNTLLNPATDIQEDANHVFYCLENYISVTDDKKGLCIIAKDTPLAALGNTGIYKYLNEYRPPEEPVIYFNLFNNMWGTNFPQWIGGDLSYRFVLFGFHKEEEASVLERAVMLNEGIELTHNNLGKDFGEFPVHMQLINVRKVDGDLILRFKELSGESTERTLRLENSTITRTDLNNNPVGESTREEYWFKAEPYGIYSFLVSKIIPATTQENNIN